MDETGLEMRQIKNWFINHRKRNWNSRAPNSSSGVKPAEKQKAESKKQKAKSELIINIIEQISYLGETPNPKNYKVFLCEKHSE